MARTRKEVAIVEPTDAGKDVPPVPPAKNLRITPKYIKYYLVGYNVLSALGWAYVLGLTLVHLFNIDGKSNAIASVAPTATSTFSRFLSPLFKSAPKSIVRSSVESKLPVFLQPLYARSTTTFGRVAPATAFVQSFAVLEIFHVLLGWVRSPIQTTAIQVFSRLYLVWGIGEQFPAVRSSPFYTTMILAWSTTEIIRYPFYASNLLGVEPYPLLYLRYTAFYILYPLGALSEAYLIYATLPSSSPIPSWKSWLIGIWKPTDYIRAILTLIWPPGLYVMYTHMIAQRRKVLGPGFLPTKSKVN